MRRLLLVGAGHAHMALLAHAGWLRTAGIDVTLVAPGNFWYGGAVAAMLAGRMPHNTLRVPLSVWCRNRDIDLQIGRVLGLDVKARQAGLADGTTLDYDAVAINAGASATALTVPERTGREPGLWDAASVAAMERLRIAMIAACGRGARPRIAVVGGGARAATVAAGLAGADAAGRCRLSVYTEASRLLPEAPRGAGRRLARELSRRGVDIVFDTSIERLHERAAVSRDGRRFPADHVVLAAGEQSARLIHATGLPAGDDGLQVDARLCSPLDPHVFASGACAYLMNAGRLSSVDSERQAATLTHNLCAVLAGKPLQRYRPVPRPCLIDLADDTGIGWSGRLWWHGPAIARAHRHRRERFMRRLTTCPASK